MKFKYWILFIMVTAIGAVSFFQWPGHAKVIEYIESNIFKKDVEIVEVKESVDNIIDESWVSAVVPKMLKKSGFDLQMNFRKDLESVAVVWRHPANGEEEKYVLQEFEPGDGQALYKIRAEFNNLLAGWNEYELLGYVAVEGVDGVTEELSANFSVLFDLKEFAEVVPEVITFNNLPDQTDGDELELEGSLKFGAEVVRVYSYNAELGKATFARLGKYEPGTRDFTYNATENNGNLLPGLNVFVVEVLDEEGEVASRKYIELTSTKVSLPARIKELFDSFVKVEGGWFVSTKLPWFSLRPVFQDVHFKVDDEDTLVLPRPTLMYTAESNRDTALCDYLGGKDFEEEGMIYVGYSFETCQQYRHGVAVYDRFLSTLEYEPVKTISRFNYKDVADKVSSAFVMIENGGMALAEAEEVVVEEEEKVGSQLDPEVEEVVEAEREPIFYVYQMLITESVDHVDDKIGDIEEELTEDRRATIEEIRELLTEYAGDELFTNDLSNK